MIIFQEQKLDDIESILAEEGVRNFTISQVQERGRHTNVIDTHALNTHYQLDVFIGHSHTQSLVGALLDTLCVSQLRFLTELYFVFLISFLTKRRVR